MVKKKEMKSRPENEGDMLNRLSAGLSEQEIRCVLAGALSDLDHAGVDRLLKRVGHACGQLQTSASPWQSQSQRRMGEGVGSLEFPD